MKLKHVLLLSCLIAQATPSFAQAVQPATRQELKAMGAAAIGALTNNAQELQSKLGLYPPTDADLARFVAPEDVPKLKENHMGLSMGKYAEYVIATIEGHEVLLRSSSILRDGILDLKASGAFVDVPGNQFLNQLQDAAGSDTLKIHLTVQSDGKYDYEIRVENMHPEVEDKVLARETGKLQLQLIESRIDRALHERSKSPLEVDTRDAVRKVEKR